MTAPRSRLDRAAIAVRSDRDRGVLPRAFEGVRSRCESTANRPIDEDRDHLSMKDQPSDEDQGHGESTYPLFLGINHSRLIAIISRPSI